MSIKETITLLESIVSKMEFNLSMARGQLCAAKDNIQNHVYESIEKAEGFLYNQFDNEAANDCEGSGNCGCEEYTQDFIVDGKEYTATGKFEYDRHDKTYYYVDSSEYSYKEK